MTKAFIARHKKTGVLFLCEQAGAGTLYHLIKTKDNIFVDEKDLIPVTEFFGILGKR